jgi:hypothetical protein
VVFVKLAVLTVNIFQMVNVLFALLAVQHAALQHLV